MSKFTLFTVFLSAFIMVIVAELLVDEYLKTPYQQNLQANVVGIQNTAEINEEVPPNITEQEVPASSSEAALDVETETVTPGVSQTTTTPADDSEKPSISFGLITQAGFKDITLQRVLFNGVLFDLLDVKDLTSIPVLEQHLLKNNSARVATFFEFSSKNKNLAQDIYLLLKQKSSNANGVFVNETNSFGESSFYINNLEQAEQVFLVVKKGDHVYALTYRKDYHPFIVELLGLL